MSLILLEVYPTIFNQIDRRSKVTDTYEEMEVVFTCLLVISTCIVSDILLDFCRMGGQALEMYYTELYLLTTSQLKDSYPHWILQMSTAY